MKAISRIKPKNRKKRLAERFNSSFTSTSCTPSVLDCHPMIQPVIPLNSLNSHLLYNVSRLYPGQRAEAVICTKKSFLHAKTGETVTVQFTHWGLMLAMTSPSHTKLWLHQTNNYSLMPCLAASQLANYQNQLIQQNQPIHVSP